ncbi:MAG: PCRF domain-containing protein, partial [Anaerolineae bacterium]|nr:PCRF domain-containing protein [Anaerolineae bacterium]
MFEKLSGIAVRYEELDRLLNDPANLSDYEKIATLSQEKSSLQELYDGYLDYRRIEEHRAEAEAVLESGDTEMRDLAHEELEALEAQRVELEQRLKLLLLPTDPRDAKNVIVEIRAGTGGDEAGLFAGDLFRMYTRYAENHGWKIELISTNATGQGGYKEVVFELKARGAFSRMKYESGVHRVQRVPATESQGRIHTSTATVAVMAEVDDVEVHIDEKDL